MARGNQGRKIFADDADRRRFLETLAGAVEKTGWWIHAYVLMGNHYHLLVETPEANLVAGMQWLQGTYTRRYNGRHQVFGHLFQGRYKAVVVEGKDPNYLQVVSTYIHLNPARAGLIRVGQELLKRYRWSSYPWYLSRQGPAWLKREVVLGSLRLRPGDRRGYEAYLEGRALELGNQAGRAELEAKWRALRRGWYLGAPAFLEKLADWLERAVKGRRRESQAGLARTAHDTAAAEQWLSAGLKHWGLKAEKLGELGYGAPEKVVLAWWLRRRTTVSLRWVGERLQMGHYSRVSQAVSRANRKPARKLRRLMQALAELDEK
jgi:putative transposase